MTHNEVWKKFEQMFCPGERVKCWFPNGKDSIRVRLADGDVVFTYQSKKIWKIESVDSYLESIKVNVTWTRA